MSPGKERNSQGDLVHARLEDARFVKEAEHALLWLVNQINAVLVVVPLKVVAGNALSLVLGLGISR